MKTKSAYRADKIDPIAYRDGARYVTEDRWESGPNYRYYRTKRAAVVGLKEALSASEADGQDVSQFCSCVRKLIDLGGEITVSDPIWES